MRFRITLGVLLILSGIGLLLVLVVLPVLPGSNDNPDVLNFFASLLCEPGERAEIEVVVTHDSDGTGYTPYTTCVGREGQRTDVSGKHFIYSMLGFIVPFMIGLFMVIANANALQRQHIWDTGQRVVGVAPDGLTAASAGTAGYRTGFVAPEVEVKDGLLKIGGVEIRMDGISPDQVKALQRMSSVTANAHAADSGSFVAKLKQIQEALDAGLITQAEYDSLRQEILDKLV